MTTTISGTTGVSQCQPGSVSQDDLAANIAGNGPAFSGKLSANQAVSNATWTKVLCATEEFDTSAMYDAPTARFTPTVPGYYQLSGFVGYGTSSMTGGSCSIYKNGALFKGGSAISPPAFGGFFSTNVSCLVYLNGTTDYVELWGYVSATTPVLNTDSYFQGYLARAA